MELILGFAPFLAFAVVSHLAGAEAGLLAGALASVALVSRDLLRGRSPKILELGTAALFAVLGLYTWFAAPQWSLMAVRLVVDTGLLLIVLGSLLAGRPFTMQYAREQLPQDYWNTPAFMAVNRRITAVWALAFVAIVVADLLLLLTPDLSPHIGIALTGVALLWATKRTAHLSRQASR